MTIGARQGDGQYDVEEVSAELKRSFFCDDADESDEEFLFPDLKHGEEFVLDGLITRGNQSTNSIGFQYQGHILNCIPETGNVRKFKPAMFLQCRITCIVNRHVYSLTRLDYRPTLLISHVLMLEDDGEKQEKLF